jgi:hypothetical protein
MCVCTVRCLRLNIDAAFPSCLSSTTHHPPPSPIPSHSTQNDFIVCPRLLHYFKSGAEFHRVNFRVLEWKNNNLIVARKQGSEFYANGVGGADEKSTKSHILVRLTLVLGGCVRNQGIRDLFSVFVSRFMENYVVISPSRESF